MSCAAETMAGESGGSRNNWPGGISSFLTGPWPVCMLLALFWWMTVSAKTDWSVTFDELPHLTGGYSYWLTNDYRLEPENGNLSQRWVALPLLLGHYQFPPLDHPAWLEGNIWGVGHEFFYKLSNDLQTMLLSGRAMMAVLAVGVGVLVYAWSRSLFGPFGGLISLMLFVFCPNLLAHGGLMTSDVPVALFLNAAVWSFWTMLQHVSIRTVLLSALAAAALLLSKLSGLVFLPMAALLLLIRLAMRRPLHVSLFNEAHVYSTARQLGIFGLTLVVQAVIVVTVLWSFYGFRYSAFADRSRGDQFMESWEDVLSSKGPLNSVTRFVRDHRLLPEAYVYGVAFAAHHMTARRAFLNGEYRETGWWNFFPYALLVKTPLPLFVLLVLAAAGLPRVGRETRYATIPLWVLLVVYWGVSLPSHLNIGHRHILPTYLAMFVLTGAAVVWFRPRARLLPGLVLASLVWFIAESVSIRPHYLAYFNQVAGGPSNGYRHLVDSSLDWGQNLPGLKRWLEAHDLNGSAQTPVYLAYFGTGSPAYYGIEAKLLTEPFFDTRFPAGEALKPLTGGVYAVSATMLQTIHILYWGPWTSAYERRYRTLLEEVEEYKETEKNPAVKPALLAERQPDLWKAHLETFDQLRQARLLAYLRTREPDDHIGYSILIYRLTNDQVRQALYAPAFDTAYPPRRQ